MLAIVLKAKKWTVKEKNLGVSLWVCACVYILTWCLICPRVQLNPRYAEKLLALQEALLFHSGILILVRNTIISQIIIFHPCIHSFQLFKEHYRWLILRSFWTWICVNIGAIAQIQSHWTWTPYILQLEHTTPSAWKWGLVNSNYVQLFFFIYLENAN